MNYDKEARDRLIASHNSLERNAIDIAGEFDFVINAVAEYCIERRPVRSKDANPSEGHYLKAIQKFATGIVGKYYYVNLSQMPMEIKQELAEALNEFMVCHLEVEKSNCPEARQKRYELFKRIEWHGDIHQLIITTIQPTCKAFRSMVRRLNSKLRPLLGGYISKQAAIEFLVSESRFNIDSEQRAKLLSDVSHYFEDLKKWTNTDVITRITALYNLMSHFERLLKMRDDIFGSIKNYIAKMAYTNSMTDTQTQDDINGIIGEAYIRICKKLYRYREDMGDFMTFIHLEVKSTVNEYHNQSVLIQPHSLLRRNKQQIFAIYFDERNTTGTGDVNIDKVIDEVLQIEKFKKIDRYSIRHFIVNVQRDSHTGLDDERAFRGDDTSLEEQIMSQSAIEQLPSILETFTELEQQIAIESLLNREDDKVNLSKIADNINVPYDKVRSTYYRTIEKLKDILKDHV